MDPKTPQRADTGKGGRGKGPAMPPRNVWLIFLAVLLVNFLVMKLLLPSPDAPLTVPYTAFKDEVARKNVEAIYSKGASIEGRFARAVTWPPPGFGEGDPLTVSESGRKAPEPRTAETFLTELPAFVGPGLEAFLIEHDVEISAVPIQDDSPWSSLLFGFGPALLFIAFYVWMFRRAARQGGGIGGALMGMGRSQARRYDKEQDTRVTFEDVAGIDEAKEELQEIIARGPASLNPNLTEGQGATVANRS